MKFFLMFLSVASTIFSQNNWTTKFEQSNYLSTSNYDESIRYFQKIADSSEYAELYAIGISPQGRELKCLVVSKNKNFTAEQAKKSDDAIILINNGIHAGEIEGKDASMLMLREMLIANNSAELIDNVTLLIIPIFNLDGHERRSPFGRINQNGPTEMGWRVTAQNLNLNRDFTKGDAPEMRSFLKLYNEWLPDIFIDNHTTNGADYQYTITYAISKHIDVPPATQELVNKQIIPIIDKSMDGTDYLISPFVGFIDRDYYKGIRDWLPIPRFSNGYGSTQNRIGLLVETHMLKPYKDRVFSTKTLMEAVISFASINHKLLRETSSKADEYVLKKFGEDKNHFPIKYKLTDNFIDFKYKGFEKVYKDSEIAGDKVVSYTNNKTEKVVPYYNDAEVADSIKLPNAYLIPKEWGELVNRIKLHGVDVLEVSKEKIVNVEKYKFKNVTFSKWPYEGRFIPSFEYDVIKGQSAIREGDYIVPTNQRAIGMIVHSLEPKALDSFVKWGFMNIIFERKEYFEEYSMEPIAQKMYSESKKMRKEFDSLVNSDTTFAKNKRERLNFFYKKSPYYDQKHNLYPILRIVN